MFSTAQHTRRPHDDLVIEDLSATVPANARICICICWIDAPPTGKAGIPSQAALTRNS